MENITEYINVTSITDETIIISDETLSYFILINSCGISEPVTILGLIVNVINMVVFVRQDLRDSVNISLLALSISDFGSLVFLLFCNLCWTPSILKMNLPFYPTQIVYFLVWTHIAFTRVTTGTTAWITFERCLCIVLPLKIKSIITPRRTVTFIVVLYVIMFASVVPVFYTTRVVWLFDSRRNRSILGTAKITANANIQIISFWINNILPTIFFIFITICTVILVKALNKNKKWKKKTAFSKKQKLVSNKDTKVIKMVTIISIVFIACYAPGTVVFVFILIYPQANYVGKQRNLMVAMYSVLLGLEAINATSNFFIYLAMSSKFKSVFQNLLYVYFSKKKQRNESTARRIIAE